MTLYRVFGCNDADPDRDSLLLHLHNQRLEGTAKFWGDKEGWYQADLKLDDNPAIIRLERELFYEEGVRTALNVFAALVESLEPSPDQEWLMEHIISARQLFTLKRPSETTTRLEVERLCLAVCQFLAKVTDGFYAIEDQGFFREDGSLILKDT